MSNKPKAYVGDADPNYTGTYSDGSRTAKYIWVDENGTPIITKDLDKYDLSKKERYIPQTHLPSEEIEAEKEHNQLVTEEKLRRIGKEYSPESWAKIFGGLGAVGVGIGLGGAFSPWLAKTAMPAVAKYYAAPTLAGMAVDEALRAVTGTTLSEQVSNGLQNYGWNPYVSDFVGGLTNPGYWINFGGTGQYTRPLFNKVGLGLSSPSEYTALSPEFNNIVSKTVKESTDPKVFPIFKNYQLSRQFDKNIKSNLYLRILSSNPIPFKEITKETYLYRNPTLFSLGVKTSGVHKTTVTGPITGSRFIDDPNNPTTIKYSPSRVVSSVEYKDPEMLDVRNYQLLHSIPRGTYIESGIEYDRAIDMMYGFRPNIEKTWINPENGFKIFDLTSNYHWPMTTSGRWLSNKELNWFWTDLQKIPITLFHKKGGKLNAAQSARECNTDTRKIDMSLVSTEDNLNRVVDREAYSQLQDSLIARNYPFVQRMAILGTSMLEASPGSYGVGGGGYLGLSSDRMPKSLLGNTPNQRARQITYVLDDLERTHPDNWLDGGSGGIRINSGKDGYNMFWNALDINTATQALNKSYVRPKGREKAWNNRSKVAKTLSTKVKSK